MRFAFSLAAAAAFAAAGSADTIDRGRLDRIDGAVQAALKRGDCPGAVVVVVHRDAVVFRRAYGLAAKVPAERPMAPDAVFDLASLTKPVATATCVMALVERGDLRLSDRVAKYWPEFGENGKGDVTVEQCLLHTTGLTADNPEGDYRGGREKALERIAALRLEAPPGARFRYSDVGFICLGEVVAKVSGKPLDEFARETVFAPLGMADTGFLPAKELRERVVPTGKRSGAGIAGEVHDPRAFLMGGVAGHAGLFGTADDLARFCRMLLRGGELDGKRVLGPLTVRLLTEPRPVPTPPARDAAGPPDDRPQLRTRGWDADTGYSSPRGDLFPRGEGFGHTGFTGTSVWVDGPSKTAVIILTSRLHPDDNPRRSVNELRRRIGTIVASAILERAEVGAAVSTPAVVRPAPAPATGPKPAEESNPKPAPAGTPPAAAPAPPPQDPAAGGLIPNCGDS